MLIVSHRKAGTGSYSQQLWCFNFTSNTINREQSSSSLAIQYSSLHASRHTGALPVKAGVVQLQTKDGVEYDGVLEPSKKFTEHYQLLFAHSVVHCSGNNTLCLQRA